MDISFLIFNFGRGRLRNLWHTMNCVKSIVDNNPKLKDNIEFILVEYGDKQYSETHANVTGFKYIFYEDDPLCTSHRSTLRNKAVEESTTDWVILHDNDIIPDPKFFEDILNIINSKNSKLKYFSNFKSVINLDERLSDLLITDLKESNRFEYGYINGTDPEETNNFIGLPVRPHGYFTFTEATGGSFTVKKSEYLKVKFDEKYNQWGAEDNAFKLYMIKEIGWECFGMINKVLLHSYHETFEINQQTGGNIFMNEALNNNRNRFYNALNEISPTLNTELYDKLLKNKLYLTFKKENS